MRNKRIASVICGGVFGLSAIGFTATGAQALPQDCFYPPDHENDKAYAICDSGTGKYRATAVCSNEAGEQEVFWGYTSGKSGETWTAPGEWSIAYCQGDYRELDYTGILYQ